MEGFLIGEPISRGELALRTYAIPSRSAIGQWGWDFHTVQGGFDAEDHRFRPWVVGVEVIWRD